MKVGWNTADTSCRVTMHTHGWSASWIRWSLQTRILSLACDLWSFHRFTSCSELKCTSQGTPWGTLVYKTVDCTESWSQTTTHGQLLVWGIDGALKMTDMKFRCANVNNIFIWRTNLQNMKLQYMKMTDRIAWHENCRTWNCKTWQISFYCCFYQSQ